MLYGIEESCVAGVMGGAFVLGLEGLGVGLSGFFCVVDEEG